MCGFAGFSGCRQDREAILAEMTERIRYRGPDSGRCKVYGNYALGFRRLAVIDPLPEGDQPMETEDGKVVCVFNGEIYNHLALREELTRQGHHFRTRCDTEVLLHGYEAYGRELPAKLRGMFAFAILDLRRDLLFCARDLFGIKPFFYTQTATGAFLFASEIKCFFDHPEFQKRLNPKALLPYLSLQYAAPSEPFFAGVRELLPGGTLTVRDGVLTEGHFAEHSAFRDPGSGVAPDPEALSAVLADSVDAHRRADVPLGAFLSGGVDSGLLCSLLRPQHTFSVGFREKQFDETGEAAELASQLGTCHHGAWLSPEACFAVLPSILYHMEEPYANPSVLPLWFLCREAAKTVTVVLSGEGADELFAGYESYLDPPALRAYKKLPAFLRRAASEAAMHLPYFPGHDRIVAGDSRPDLHFIGQAAIFSPSEGREILTAPYRNAPTAWELTAPICRRAGGAGELSQKQYLDLHFFLPCDILRKADRMSMAASLELRVPYLDREVLRLAAAIPPAERVGAGTGKLPLRRVAARYLPSAVAMRQKKGFPVPIRIWLREEQFASQVRAMFKASWTGEFFRRERLLALLDAHQAGKINNGRKIWTVYQFLLWYQTVFLKSTPPAEEEVRGEGHANRGI